MVKVACCWDDGVINDIRLTELLRKYEAKATFNLNPGCMAEERKPAYWADFVQTQGAGYHGYISGKVGLKELTQIYQGFQVASHGWMHLTSTLVTPEEFMKDAMDARNYLEDAFQRPCLGFAWPCGAVRPEAAQMMQEAGFLYGRTTTYTDHVGKTDSPMRLESSCHFMAGDFYKKFEAAKAENGIFYFWGHSYEMMDSQGLWNQMEQKLAMLHNDPQVQWIDVIDIVR